MYSNSICGELHCTESGHVARHTLSHGNLILLGIPVDDSEIQFFIDCVIQHADVLVRQIHVGRRHRQPRQQQQQQGRLPE